ncbi:hypothetical protein RA307_01340 [Xanthobacteraceae bacterium Astr-EGSB]|uniref:hypothetical protein n=1 Tax=Astrobacterium formosum TaxID=3069710 RepID=UPI0027B3C66A|nr:hypothetical protein [Xanthobacteraceae bacterium Astr-EGSB]
MTKAAGCCGYSPLVLATRLKKTVKHSAAAGEPKKKRTDSGGMSQAARHSFTPCTAVADLI